MVIKFLKSVRWVENLWWKGFVEQPSLKPKVKDIQTYVHRVSKKTKQICFCQNFVKFPPILIIFGRKMGNDPDICEVQSFSTSPNLRHHLTVLNANVPNSYITPKLLVIDSSHWRPQFNRGSRTFRDHSNFRQFVHI